MSLNLNKHGMAMQKAWKEVANAKMPTNWALYGYDTGTFDLNLVATGQDGIEELKDDLSPEKVLYAFIRIDDESGSLPKFVFLVWIGESTPGTRKGKAATHVRTIEQYFHGHHLTINARNEDDVDADEIAAKVSKIKVGAGVPGGGFADVPEPVGSCHKKIVVKKELPDMNERERFWNDQENREKQRIEDERMRKIEEQKKLDRERRDREEKETKAREALIRDREKKISQAKVEDRGEETRMKKERERWVEQQETDRMEEKERQNRGEEMRRKRSEEAKQLISQSSGQSARAVFERNTSMGQMNFRKNSVPAPREPEIVREPVREPVPEEINRLQKVVPNMVSTEDIVVPPPDSFGNEIPIPEPVPVVEPEIVPPPPPDVTNNSSQPDLIQDVHAQEHKSEPDVTKAPEPTTKASGSCDLATGGHSGYGTCAMALYDYQAADETEISFDPGQIITHIDKIDPGWWQGLSPTGNYGLFPSNYVDLIDPKDLTTQQNH